MLNTILTGWNFMRWLRLLLSITIAIQAFQSHDLILGLISGFLFLQVVANTGCCGTGNCKVDTLQNNSKKADIEFEEVKS